jgi:hypothetical protein
VLVGVVAVVLLAGFSGSAMASSVSGPHETLSNQFSTVQPNAPTGFRFSGSYHGASDPAANPPYMRRMVSFSPPGLRFDTSVPERCTATDLELEIFGAGACPAGSRLGGGTTTTSFLGRVTGTVQVDFFSSDDEQIILAHSPVLATVARGRLSGDSVSWASPTCYPFIPLAGCPVDSVLQLASTIIVAPYTRVINGAVRSYMTTPPSCPTTGYWENPFRLWWADGSVDTVVVHEPCAPEVSSPSRSAQRSAPRRHGHHRRVRGRRHTTHHRLSARS